MSYYQPTFFINFISFFVIKEFYFLWIKLYAFISGNSYIISFSIELYEYG